MIGWRRWRASGRSYSILTVFSGIMVSAALADSLEDPFASIWDAPVVNSARPEDRLFQTPVGAFTLDSEALNYLPANSIPEMLRFAPGVHIQRTTNGVWGMGIRGMNSRFYGRTVFTVDEQNPYGDLFGGIFGSVHVMLLEDVASIEVVRGPGGGLWETNASNGMVNVIPKTAFETEGGHLLLRGGSEERWAEARYGWSTGEASAARVYALASHREPGFSAEGIDDSWDTNRVGFRFDHRPDDSSLVSLSAEAFDSELSFFADYSDMATGILRSSDKPEKQSGLNAQAKWLKNFSNGGGIVTRAWAGTVEFDSSYSVFDLVSAGAEARLEYPWMEGHQFSVTAGLSYEQSDLVDSEVTKFRKDGAERTRIKLGLRESWELAPERWSIVGGITGSYVPGLEELHFQPDLRLVFTPQKESVFWLSASRAIRAISSDSNAVEQISLFEIPIEPVTIPTPLGPQTISKMVIVGATAEEVNAEELTAFEMGHRHAIGDSVVFGFSAFYNLYDNITYGYVNSPPIPVLFVPEPYFAQTLTYDNIAKGHSYGLEFDLNWRLNQSLRLKLAYSFLEDSFEALFQVADPAGSMVLADSIRVIDNNVPRHLGSIWLTWEPLKSWRFDGTLRYDDGFRNPRTIAKDNIQLDFRATWEPDDRWRLSLVGRNLLDAHTDEGAIKDFVGLTTEVEREWYLEVRYAF